MKMLKNMTLYILLYMFLSLGFKIATCFARTTASVGKFVYQRMFQIIKIRVFKSNYFEFLNEVKTSMMLNVSLQNC